jgi:hypothetical protein
MLICYGKANEKMKGRGPIARDEAEALAIQALSFIAADAERLAQFLDVTGIAPIQIRAAAGEPEFLTGVLEYLTANEQLLTEFAVELAADPADIGSALMTLRGVPWERQIP